MEIPRFSTEKGILAASVLEGLSAFALTTTYFDPYRGFLMGLNTSLITFCLLESTHARHEAIQLEVNGKGNEAWPTATGGMMLSMMGAGLLSATLAFAATKDLGLGTLQIDRDLVTIQRVGAVFYTGLAGSIFGGYVSGLAHDIGLKRALRARDIPRETIAI